MKITRVTAEAFRVPLLKPFVTALRSASFIENVLIKIETGCGGLTGYGEAAAIPAVTGETVPGIISVVQDFIAPRLVGRSPEDLPDLIEIKNSAVKGNTSAKAGVESALYGLLAKSLNIPLYRLLGGSENNLPENNLTVSASSAEQMISDTIEAARSGFRHIKIKLGRSPETDGGTLVKIHRAVTDAGFKNISYRVDGNCGWSVKEAVTLLRLWEDDGVNVEWAEQPVAARDLEGLKLVTRSVSTPVMADESCFGLLDAVRILEARAADMINVKLAKAGGISSALAIARLCKEYGAPCMMGSMLESALGSGAAVHAAATGLFFAADLDGPLLCGEAACFTNGEKRYFSGVEFKNQEISFQKAAR